MGEEKSYFRLSKAHLNLFEAVVKHWIDYKQQVNNHWELSNCLVVVLGEK